MRQQRITTKEKITHFCCDVQKMLKQICICPKKKIFQQQKNQTSNNEQQIKNLHFLSKCSVETK